MRILKNTLALAGLGLAVIGEKLDRQPLIYAAMACLVGALVLRLVLRRQG